MNNTNTSHTIQHLKIKHKIDIKRADSENNENFFSLTRIISQYFATATHAADSITCEKYRALVFHIDTDNFK